MGPLAQNLVIFYLTIFTKTLRAIPTSSTWLTGYLLNSFVAFCSFPYYEIFNFQIVTYAKYYSIVSIRYCFKIENLDGLIFHNFVLISEICLAVPKNKIKQNNKK